MAVGAAGPTTPLGRDFYVQSAFVPTDPFFGTFALETSAYARVSDWPTSVVGIHGTNQPELSGRRFRTAASASRTTSRARLGDSRRSARRSTSCGS